MYAFIIELVRIWRGSPFNKVGIGLVTVGALSIQSISQYVIPALLKPLVGNISFPETPAALSMFLICAGILSLVLGRVLPDRASLFGSWALPSVRAVINRGSYPGGWRSVQLHVMPPEGQEKNFDYGRWRIEGMKLLAPRDAVLARAQNDDYASRIFYPNEPVRALNGKAENLPQRFALEFFIKFKGVNDRGREAKFKVKFSAVNDKWKGRTMRVLAKVPENAD